jgi:cyclase
MQLTDNVYVETGYMGANVGFITTEQGIVMIETPQKPTDAVDWKKQVQEKGEVRYIINTEGHGDHITGDFFFDGVLITHEKTREAIAAADKGWLHDQINIIDPDGARLIENYEFKIPDITFSHNMTLDMGSHMIQMMNLPGHTEGQTAVFIPEEKVVFTGDNINYQVPAFMHESLPLKWIESINMIDSLDVDYIVPGHGEVCNKDYLGEWRAFIQEWVDTIMDAIDKGWTKEEAIEKIDVPSRFKMPPEAPEDMARMLRQMNISRLYDQLS